MPDRADNHTARILHLTRAVLQHGQAIGVIQRNEEPLLSLRSVGSLDDGRGECVTILEPVTCVGRTLFSGQLGRGGAGDHHGALVLCRKALNGQGNRRKREVQEGVDIRDIDPLPGNVHGNVGLVLMIGVNDFDRLPQHLAAEIRGGHLGDLDGAQAPRVGKRTAFIAENADLHDLVRYLCESRRARRRCEHGQCECRAVRDFEWCKKPSVSSE